MYTKGEKNELRVQRKTSQNNYNKRYIFVRTERCEENIDIRILWRKKCSFKTMGN